MGLEQSVSDSPFALWLVYPCAKWSSLPSLPCWLQHISFFFMNMFLCQFYSLSRSCFSLDWLCCKSMLASRAPLAWPATVTWRVCSHLLPLETLYTPWGWLSWFLFLIASVRLPAPKNRLLFFFVAQPCIPRSVQHWPVGDFATCQLLVFCGVKQILL